MGKEYNMFLSNYINVDDPLKDKDIIHKISVITAHYAYRNGPIEYMHGDRNKNIYDDNMKVLNKLIVNRLAAIFNIILDSDKVNHIKEKYDWDNIERQLADVTMIYVFEEGFKKQEVVIKNLDDNDINKLYDFMKFKLEVVFDIILKGSKDDIRSFLAYGILYGQSWDYAIPEVLTFEEFLQKLQAVQ
ncbi:hypothetical protein [Clostridium botulinum]|uniref:hypothetical protein n=1 Tax=Clostridium botulinum TaxID=1491 RepID=UPI000581C562|nr:hypothetical protein [Clostridium botulinum]APQ98255.1 hypothetical protein RSJ3_3144 [Clostridium botulinum]KEI74928.1 hypothetical protein N486_03750 [Clostridium botulinum B2 128]KEI88654.1 hypothetical protein N493_03745 [Clostridium botulinum B2 433]MBN3361140.1 hypothetical protein [Clostridium botulinum]NFI41445.1 hypothetical protein [Clostridium botulinum]